MTLARRGVVGVAEYGGPNSNGQGEVADGMGTNTPPATACGAARPQFRHAATGMPMSPTQISPACSRPDGVQSPAFIAVSVHVAAATTQGSYASPLVASRPLGTSTLSTATPAARSEERRV